MSKDTYISTNVSGKLNDKTRTKIKETLEHWGNKKIIVTVTPTEIKIKKLYGNRSLPQNAYLHFAFGILTDGLNDLGNEFTMLQVKEMVKVKFLLTDIVDESTGEVIGQYVKRTRDLDKLEMVDFVDKFIAYSKDMFNITIPLPNQAIELELTEQK